MFRLFDRERTADLFVPAGGRAVELAASDLASDVERLGGRRPVVKRFAPRDESGYLLVGTIGTPEVDRFLASRGIDVSVIAGGWERYLIRTFGHDHENLLVVGSDPRGTMWGVYHLCEHVLGVDPAWLWTDNEPEPRE
ncbi:MAG: hypothetical protein ACOC0E_13400, partial [Spirochaetota bacterium]